MERFDYSGPYRSFAAADQALTSMFAEGDVCEGESPRIERRNRQTRKSGSSKVRYYVTIRGA